ncbi:nucleoside hydrolase [Oceanobacillus salinisoli]|uniref:nucleoside hydrolase n=1 Tax=Oceanobacillus salinisoli TaxID=2678611 RepID=UPI0012E1E1E2|nr:nucleoside hydrolase [Oceanobacillus salinisoli]
MSKVILDTDIGTNPDDVIAYVLAIKSPEIDLLGVTTVYGDTEIRGKIAQAISELCHSHTIPIYQGIERPLLRKRKVYWTGLEEQLGNLSDSKSPLEEKQKHAVDFIIETIMTYPGEITLVPIGPLTNVAAAIIREPKIIENVKEIVIMGGVTRLGSYRLSVETSEHNVTCDPEAASVVFSSGAPITMIGLDVTRQLMISKQLVEQFASGDSTIVKKLSKMMLDFMDYKMRDYSYLCDPLAIAVLLDRSLIETTRMHIDVLYEPQTDKGITLGEIKEDGKVKVALEVDKERFFELISNRIFS